MANGDLGHPHHDYPRWDDPPAGGVALREDGVRQIHGNGLDPNAVMLQSARLVPGLKYPGRMRTASWHCGAGAKTSVLPGYRR